MIPVHAWQPPGGDLADRGHPSPYLRALWREAAWERLWQAIELAFGGMPEDVTLAPEVIRGEPGYVLVGAAAQPGDMLVIGAGRRGAVAHALSCKVSRYCVAHAQCPVIAVPPPVLAQLSHGLRGWAFRHRGLSPDRAKEPAA
jgi:nucleotide-binding universal stress UspA family protein